ncbi:hypothetical protein J1605_019170 [Eschrichtius robustus]|uniref:Uncharacterized protein n=1 Tax=Eschrichtius robustus TaxID=9764 RepID=A0AB34HQD1_ESCRO|nr:hypothetical protein J1605_019170 [Eschrichtius robustus]
MLSRPNQRAWRSDRSVQIPLGPTCPHPSASPGSGRRLGPGAACLDCTLSLPGSPGTTVREPSSEPIERTLPRVPAAPPARPGEARLGSRSPPRPWPEPARRRRRRRRGSCRCSLRCCCCPCCCRPAAGRWKVSGVGGRVQGLRCPGLPERGPARVRGVGPMRAGRTSEEARSPAPFPGAGGWGGEDALGAASEAPATSVAGSPPVAGSRAARLGRAFPESHGPAVSF